MRGWSRSASCRRANAAPVASGRRAPEQRAGPRLRGRYEVGGDFSTRPRRTFRSVRRATRRWTARTPAARSPPVASPHDPRSQRDRGPTARTRAPFVSPSPNVPRRESILILRCRLSPARHVVGDNGRRVLVQRSELYASGFAAPRDDRALGDDPARQVTALEPDLNLAADLPLPRDARQRQPALADVHGAHTANPPLPGRGERRDRLERRARVLAGAARHDAVDLHGLRPALDRDIPQLAGREPALHVLVGVLADHDRRAVGLRDGLDPGRKGDVFAQPGRLEAL